MSKGTMFILAVATAAVAVTSTAATPQSPQPHAASAQAIEARAISSGPVALRAEAIRQLRNLAPADAEKEAVTQLAREQALLILAQREGTVVPETLVRSEIARFRALAETAPDDTGRQAFAKAAEQLGVSVDAFFTDPRVIAAYQRAFTIGDMRNRLQRRLGVESGDDAALDRAIDAFAVSSGIRIDGAAQ